jgi:xanthine/uracil/vitamin C permease (AzgA family)
MVALGRMTDMVYEDRQGSAGINDDNDGWVRGGKWVLGKCYPTMSLFVCVYLLHARMDGMACWVKQTIAWTTFGSVIGACIGCSPCVIQVESSIGIVDGARTGISSIITSILLLLSIGFAPLLAALSESSSAVAPVLILVGALMIGEVRNIDWDTMVSHHIISYHIITSTIVDVSE